MDKITYLLRLFFRLFSKRWTKEDNATRANNPDVGMRGSRWVKK